jgi:hypothetical protein
LNSSLNQPETAWSSAQQKSSASIPRRLPGVTGRRTDDGARQQESEQDAVQTPLLK